MEPLRVLVVGRDALARRGLASVLAGGAELVVAAELAPTDVPDEARPDAATIAWDLGRPSRQDLEPLSRAAEAGFAILALLQDEESVADVLASGARGVLFRDAEPSRLLAALHAIAAGLVVMDEGLLSAALRPPASTPAELVEPLTPRESEALQLLAQGLSNKKIGERLGISENTAKFHVNAILAKLGVRSRTEALVEAARLGLVIL